MEERGRSPLPLSGIKREGEASSPPHFEICFSMVSLMTTKRNQIRENSISAGYSGRKLSKPRIRSIDEIPFAIFSDQQPSFKRPLTRITAFYESLELVGPLSREIQTTLLSPSVRSRQGDPISKSKPAPSHP